MCFLVLDRDVKEARLTPRRPPENAVVTSLFLFSGHSFKITLWKGASEGKVLTYQDIKLQGTTYTPAYGIKKEMFVWAGYQKCFPRGCLVFFLISWESNPGCNPGHPKVDTEVAYVSCTTGDKCPGMSLLVSECPSRRAQGFSRFSLATKNPT